MKVFLRRIQTGDYLSAGGDWSADPAAARDFVRVSDAVEFALREGLEDVRVFLHDPMRVCDAESGWEEAIAA